MLGIPTVVDRLIQQALLQEWTPIFDPTFSESSYGFRPGRKAQEAVKKARQYVEAGDTWVVDIDLEKFFDRVHHDKLMARVARQVEDKRVLRLIRAYLNERRCQRKTHSQQDTLSGDSRPSKDERLLLEIRMAWLQSELTRISKEDPRYQALEQEFFAIARRCRS